MEFVIETSFELGSVHELVAFEFDVRAIGVIAIGIGNLEIQKQQGRFVGRRYESESWGTVARVSSNPRDADLKLGL